jgi:NarL family two-component system response regulator LiaR
MTMALDSSVFPIRLLLVDDHAIVRHGLKQLLESDPRFVVCAEAADGETALIQAMALKPDVVVMDINLPKVSGYEASKALLTVWPQARILILSNQDDTTVVQKCLDLGVKGFLLKDVQLADLQVAIQQVRMDQYLALPPELADKIRLAQAVHESHQTAGLTEREKEVLKALCRGYSNQQLADLLMVSPKTVHNHLYNIYGKIGVSTRAEAMVWAMESGVSDSPRKS